MAYTYNPLLLNVSPRDRMRFTLGDTRVEGGGDTAALSDEEYDAILGTATIGGAGWEAATVDCLRAIVARFAMLVDMKVGPLALEYEKRYARWQGLLKEKERTVGGSGLTRVAAKPASFFTGMHDNPRS